MKSSLHCRVSRVLSSTLLALSGCLWASAALAQPATGELDMKLAFEDEQTSWMPFGDGAKVAIARDPDHVKNGNGALQFSYAIAKGNISAMLLPFEPGQLTRLQTIAFWVKADHTTPLALMLQEGQNGGRWLSLFTAPRNAWQKVEMAPSDFMLMDGADDPKDDNGQLDLAQVQFVGFGDFGQFLAGFEGPMAQLFKVQTGQHVLFIDDMALSSQPPKVAPAAAEKLIIDDFSRPQLRWLGLSDTRLERVENAPDGEAAIAGMQIDYTRAKGKIGGVMQRFKQGSLQGAGGLTLAISSERAVTLALQVEENSGGKYNAMLDLPAGGEVQRLTLPFDNFTASPDSKDNNGKLDPAEIKQVLLIDIAAFTGQDDNTDNVVWMGDLRGVR